MRMQAKALTRSSFSARGWMVTGCWSIAYQFRQACSTAMQGRIWTDIMRALFFVPVNVSASDCPAIKIYGGYSWSAN